MTQITYQWVEIGIIVVYSRFSLDIIAHIPLLIGYRMSATLAYLMSRTGLYDHIKSFEYKQHFIPIAGQEEYDDYLTYLDDLRNRTELPK